MDNLTSSTMGRTEENGTMGRGGKFYTKDRIKASFAFNI
jgi:hypothetical protein